jgi:TetR/AcrR family transcriptional repressor of nem operon
MPRTADPTEIPERLFEAGLELFMRHGYSATAIQQIADRAGVPQGSFYNHFASKEEFAAAIVERYAAWCDQSWTRMMRRAPTAPIAGIRYVFEQMIDHHARERESPRCLIGDCEAAIALASDKCRERLFAAQLAWRERLAGLIAHGQAVGEIRRDLDPLTLSALTWSVWEGALLRMKVEGSVTRLRDSMAVVLDHVYRPTAAGISISGRN